MEWPGSKPKVGASLVMFIIVDATIFIIKKLKKQEVTQ